LNTSLTSSLLRHSLPAKRSGWALAVLAVAVLAACGKGNGGATQVAAKVNREEISLHQVNYLLQRQSGVAADQVEAASRQTLEALVDQELVLQAAAEQHIDRDPTVLQALDAARREIIVRAYADRLSQAVQKPSLAEVSQYYDSRPALFSKRRLYTLVDTAFIATPAQQKTIRAQLGGTRSAADVAALLRQAGLRFGARRSTVGAEALPLSAVDAMAALREGQSHLVSGPRDAHVLTIVSIEAAPLSEDSARASIENFLMAERKRQAVQQQIKALRSTARIEYGGRFAQPADGKSQAAPAVDAEAALSSVSLQGAEPSTKSTLTK